MQIREPDFRRILDKHRHDPTRLVQILHDIQDEAECVSPRSITQLSGLLGLPRARVEGVAGFYSFFTSEPKGHYRLLFSNNITDVMLGNEALVKQTCEAFGIGLGGVSADGLVSVDLTSCTGLCDQGPALLVNGRAIGRLTAERMETIIELTRSSAPLDRWPAELFTIEDNIMRKGVVLSAKLAAGEPVRSAFSRGAAGTLEELKRSGLRGRGGAGFQTSMKWEAAKNAPGPTRFVVCNADEGEPGTFKDRVLLTRYLDLVLDGMTICAFTIGAQKGFIYLRGEYRYLRPQIEAALAARRAQHLLGRNAMGHRGFDFDIDIHLGAGAYVCGEESALLESLEGKRGIPRNRPPYPVTHGYLQQPTVVNNVETFASASLITQYGAVWFTARGTTRSTGTKILSVSGDCERPGLYEYPCGVTIKQVLDDCGAKNTQGVQASGPAGTMLGPNEFHRRLAFEDVPSAGAFMIFDDSRDMLDVVVNFARFFAHESCGFCTPCRVGTTLLKQSVEKIAAGKGTQRDVKDAQRVSRMLKGASHCGLGHCACNPFDDLLAKFKPSVERKLSPADRHPAFDLDEALAAARQATGRDDAEAHFGEES
jgi:[NiFe] hydrogenase diaphorase moiety large subunit